MFQGTESHLTLDSEPLICILIHINVLLLYYNVVENIYICAIVLFNQVFIY